MVDNNTFRLLDSAKVMAVCLIANSCVLFISKMLFDNDLHLAQKRRKEKNFAPLEKLCVE